MTSTHIGSDFDDFLRDEGLLNDAEAAAAKRVIAFQIAGETEGAHVSHSELGRRRKTRDELSREAPEDPAHGAVATP